ncbi:hypothetical protein [Micrococcus terreus]|nr:hypothetical protein [Micrococcus terreus]
MEAPRQSRRSRLLVPAALMAAGLALGACSAQGTAEGPTASARAVHWIVVDVTGVPSRAESDLPRADSEDVAALAESWSASYTG